ncbi:hypothetical protein [Aquipseudomonas ullengensis]|uniref:Uncharacterized protein n=1 Tax=Aquipseudomonas ullengensis TaxID=2759166 RepID=A0A7W4QDD5_9GAMM|nr:hypothetical protein [Pseudomonas ullengensis]MBB2495946.1 hypothetical protein [Pseudomonas ullengensis]
MIGVNTMSWRLLGLSIFVAGMAGCGTAPPVQRSITDGIFANTPQQASSNVVNGGKDKIAVVLVSENTKANVEYLKARKAEKEDSVVLRAVGQGANLDAYAEVLDPNFSLGWIAKKLKTKFGSVKLVSSTSELSKYKYDYLVVVDAIYLTTGWGVNDATASYTTQFYNVDGQHVADAKSYRKTQVRSGGGGGPHGVELFRANHAVRVAALEEWDRSMDQVVQIPNQYSTTGESVTDACVKSALSVQNPTLRQQAIGACNP